jgi:hypothetical protein
VISASFFAEMAALSGADDSQWFLSPQESLAVLEKSNTSARWKTPKQDAFWKTPKSMIGLGVR